MKLSVVRKGKFIYFDASIKSIPRFWQESLHYSAQTSYFAAFRGIRDTKIEKSHGIQDKISL